MKNFFKKIGNGIETALNGANKTIETLNVAADKYNDAAGNFHRRTSYMLIDACKKNIKDLEKLIHSYEDMIANTTDEEKRRDYKATINELKQKIVEENANMKLQKKEYMVKHKRHPKDDELDLL